MRRITLVTVAMLALVSGCAPDAEQDVRVIAHDMAIMPIRSMTELSASADVVLVGTVGEVRGRELDDGGEAGNMGRPVVFFDLDITRSVRGPALASPIALGWYDLEERPVEGVSPLVPGEELLLFLERGDARTGPGIDTERVWYSPVGMDNGVFDVRGSDVVARSLVVQSVEASDVVPTEAPRLGGDALRVSLEDALRFIRPGASSS